MGYPVPNTSPTLLSRVTYIRRSRLGPNMRCFHCGEETITRYSGTHVWKNCLDCGWDSTLIKIPEAIR